MYFSNFFEVRGVCLCWIQYFWGRLWDLINSTHLGDHFLKVSKKVHFYFSLCWRHQHDHKHDFTCKCMIFSMFTWCVCVEENNSGHVCGLYSTLRKQEIISWKFQKNRFFVFHIPDVPNMAPRSTPGSATRSHVGTLVKVKHKNPIFLKLSWNDLLLA